MKQNYDKNINEIQYKIGEKIKIKNDSGHKLESSYIGPYVVIDIQNTNIIAKNEKNNKVVKIHKNRTLPYFE